MARLWQNCGTHRRSFRERLARCAGLRHLGALPYLARPSSCSASPALLQLLGKAFVLLCSALPCSAWLCSALLRTALLTFAQQERWSARQGLRLDLLCPVRPSSCFALLCSAVNTRRWLKAPFRKGVGSTPSAVIMNNLMLGGYVLCVGREGY